MPLNGTIVEFLRWFCVESRELTRTESHPGPVETQSGAWLPYGITQYASVAKRTKLLDSLGPTSWELHMIIRYKGILIFSGYKGGHKNGLHIDWKKGCKPKNPWACHPFLSTFAVRVNNLTEMDHAGMVWIYGQQTINFWQQCSLTSVLGYLLGWLMPSHFISGKKIRILIGYPIKWVACFIPPLKIRDYLGLYTNDTMHSWISIGFSTFPSIIKHSTGKCSLYNRGFEKSWKIHPQKWQIFQPRWITKG